jgi:hypothetical protein
MATTTNYNWTTPDDTSLVKDGAAAIRTLGSSIDTTTKNLNPQTTTGALAFRSATSNVNTALPIGTAGQVLRVNSGATAPEWATPAAGGGMTLLSTTTLSGTTTTISSIDQTYTDLIIRIYGVTTNSNTQDIICGMNATAGANILTVGNAAGGTTASYAREQQQITDGSRNLTAANSDRSWTMVINDYASAAGVKVGAFNGIYVGTTDTHAVMGTVSNNSTAAVTSIVLNCAQTFAGGTVKIWGLK